MNKKGSSLMIALITGVLIFFAGMIILNFIIPEIGNARLSTALDCGNLSISDGNKITCLGVDLVAPYWIIVVIAAAGGALFAKLAL